MDVYVMKEELLCFERNIFLHIAISLRLCLHNNNDISLQTRDISFHLTIVKPHSIQQKIIDTRRTVLHLDHFVCGI